MGTLGVFELVGLGSAGQREGVSFVVRAGRRGGTGDGLEGSEALRGPGLVPPHRLRRPRLRGGALHPKHKESLLLLRWWRGLDRSGLRPGLAILQPEPAQVARPEEVRLKRPTLLRAARLMAAIAVTLPAAMTQAAAFC